MPSERGYNAVIPPHVRYSGDLPNGAKLLYGEITALCNWKGFCWATNRYFADLYKVNSRTVMRYIQELERHGFISVERGLSDGSARKISIALGGDKIVTGGDTTDVEGVTKLSPTSDKNVTHIYRNNNKRKNTKRDGDIVEVFEVWKTLLKHPAAKLDQKRSARIAARLDDGFSADDLKKALRGVLLTPFYLGDNDKKQKYDGIETVFKDRAKVEMFIETADARAPKPVPEGYVDQAAWYHENFIAPQLRRREEQRRADGGA